MAFEPQTEAQKIIQAEAFGAFNRMVSSRRQRVEAVTVGIPSVLWAVVLIGALVAIVRSYHFKI